MDSSLPPLPSKGVCAVTSAPEGSRCRNKDAKGAWQVKSLPECREACVGCRFCQFFSYSPEDGDCSWFRECKELKHFGTKHTTHQLRHRNGSILDTSSEHTYRPQQTIKAVVGCKRLVGSIRQGTLPKRDAPSGVSRKGGVRTRIGLATLFATTPLRRPCVAEDGFGCALLPWCAGAGRLRSVLLASPSLSEFSFELLAIVGNNTITSRNQKVGSGSSCRFDRVWPADCPGLRIVRPSPSMVSASVAHAERVIRGGVMSYNEQRVRAAYVMLWKWELLRLGGEYDAILFSDLDVDLMPTWGLSEGVTQSLVHAVGPEWAEQLPKLMNRKASGDESGLLMLGYSDATTPLNGGLFWLMPPPDERLYIEGLSVLRAPWDARFGWEAAGAPAALVGSGRPQHAQQIRMMSWTEIDWGDFDQGFFLYMLHLRHRRGDYMRRGGKHYARHYVRGRDGKPNQRTLAYASPSFVGTPGCGWDNLKRLAFLQGLPETAFGDKPIDGVGIEAATERESSLRPDSLSPCARRYRRIARSLVERIKNTTKCCEALGSAAPRGFFGSDMVPIW